MPIRRAIPNFIPSSSLPDAASAGGTAPVVQMAPPEEPGATGPSVDIASSEPTSDDGRPQGNGEGSPS